MQENQKGQKQIRQTDMIEGHIPNNIEDQAKHTNKHPESNRIHYAESAEENLDASLHGPCYH